MNKPSVNPLQIAIIIVLALAALALNLFVLARVRTSGGAATVTLVPYSPSPLLAGNTQTGAPLEVYTLPVTLTGTSTGTPTPFQPTNTPEIWQLMFPPLKMTQFQYFLGTALKETRAADSTLFVLYTEWAVTQSYEKSKAANAPCYCTADLYDCEDFYTLTEAQICYNNCVKQGKGDIHNLDPDGDGFACRVKKKN